MTIPALPGSALHGGQREVAEVEDVLTQLLQEKPQWSFRELLRALAEQASFPSDVVVVALSQMLRDHHLVLSDDPELTDDVAVAGA